jgi:hypothetical protein
MGLIDRFQALFTPREMQEKPATAMQPPAQPFNLLKKFEIERDRKSVVEDCRNMYQEDPRARGVVNTLVRDAVKGGFEIAIEGGNATQAQTIADELIARLHLFTRLDDWGRLTLRDGDSFLELIADNTGRIVDVSRKPTLQMYRNSDDFDQFTDPMQAFYWVDQNWGIMDKPPADAVFFAEWQIIHARYNEDEGSRYGQPLFASARGAYKRIKEGEFDIAIRRKTRAGLKFVHSLTDATAGDIEKYKEANKDVLDDPWAAVADFIGSNIDIKAVQGDARLNEIDDILHHIDTWAIASPVPMELIGYGRDLNRDVLEQKKEQYDDSIVAFREWLEFEILNPLLETQWLLMGIWPGGLDWSIEWKAKETPTPVDVGDLAKSMVALKASGLFDDETLIRMFAGYVPSVDVDAVLASLAQRQAEKQAEQDNAQRIGALAMAEPQDDGDQ